MNEEIENQPEIDDKEGAISRMPRWKKILLSIALVLGVVGVALQGVAYVTGSRAPATPPTANLDGLHSNAPGADMPESKNAPFGKYLDDWSLPLMKLGFSFVVGFCIAYAVMVFAKLAAIAGGILLLALFGLQYAGIIDVNWHTLQAQFNTIIVWLQPTGSNFRAFITGNLPSSGLAAMGVLTGLKKK